MPHQFAVAIVLIFGVMLLGIITMSMIDSDVEQQQRQIEQDTTRLADLEARHDQVIDAWGAYMTDVTARVERPQVEDPTRAETEAFLVAYTEAAERRDGAGEALGPYAKAVVRLEETWVKASS